MAAPPALFEVSRCMLIARRFGSRNHGKAVAGADTCLDLDTFFQR